jgi:hypothetical protein
MSLACRSQVTIYSENCGNSPTFTPVSTYGGWQHNGNYTGSASVRNTLPSTGYAGASGGANVFFTNTAGTNLEICCIDTKCYLYAFLSVGLFKSTTASNGSEFLIEYSEDGATWIQMPFTLPTGAGSAIWRNVTLANYLPLTDSLRLRFTQTSSAGVQFRIDDINVAGIQNIQDSVISNCAGFFYDGDFYNQEGTYDFIVQDARGCDSVLRIEYIFDPGDPSCLLPIELVEFTAEDIGGRVLLRWLTLLQDAPMYLERSQDAITWDTIYTILPGVEFYIDQTPNEKNYYRISDKLLYLQIKAQDLQYFNILGQRVDIETAPPGLYFTNGRKKIKPQ